MKRIGPYKIVKEARDNWHVIDTRNDCADSNWYTKREAIRQAKVLVIRDHYRYLGFHGPTLNHVHHILDALGEFKSA
jgi:hypothetical protein